jgi:osmoprotectant transport system substrate-binding protein
VKALDYRASEIVWLTPAPTNNTLSVPFRQGRGHRKPTENLDDLGQWLSKGGQFKLAASAEVCRALRRATDLQVT